jgi:hypothetical protein
VSGGAAMRCQRVTARNSSDENRKGVFWRGHSETISETEQGMKRKLFTNATDDNRDRRV